MTAVQPSTPAVHVQPVARAPATASSWSSWSRSGASGWCSWPAGSPRRCIAAVISRQTSLPADTVFGRWMNQSGWAGPLVILVFMGTLGPAAADLAGRRRRLRRRGPARHLAPPAGRRAVAAPDLRSEGAGQPHRHPAARWPGWPFRAIVGGLVCGRQPPAGRPRRPPAEPGQRRRHGPARLVALARPDAGVRRDRTARVGRAGAVTAWDCCCRRCSRSLLQVAQLLPLPVAVRVALPATPSSPGAGCSPTRPSSARS